MNSRPRPPYEGLEFIYLPVEAPRQIDTDTNTEKRSQNEHGGDGQLVALEPYNGFGLLQLSAEENESSHSYSQRSSDPEACLDPRKLWFVNILSTSRSEKRSLLTSIPVSYHTPKQHSIFHLTMGQFPILQISRAIFESCRKTCPMTQLNLSW